MQIAHLSSNSAAAYKSIIKTHENRQNILTLLRTKTIIAALLGYYLLDGFGESRPWWVVLILGPTEKKSWKARLGSVSQRYMVLCKNRPLKKGVFTFGANVKSFGKVVFEYLVKSKNHIDFFSTKLTFNEPLLSWRGWRPPQASWSTSQLGLKQLDLNTVLLSVFVASPSHIKLHKGNKGTEQWGMRKYGSYLLSRQTKG